MTRIPTSYDIQFQPPHNNNPKLSMLQSNINRIYSQNKKLQTILQHSQSFQKMSEHVSLVHHNLSRLKEITHTINDLDQQLKTNREELSDNINQSSNFINKNIVGEIRKYREKIKGYEEKMDQERIKNRHFIRREFLKNRERFQGILVDNYEKYVKIIDKVENAYNTKLQENFLNQTTNEILKEAKIIKNNCKIQMGHLKNILFFYYDKNKYKKSDKKMDNNQIQHILNHEQNLINKIFQSQKNINDFITSNCLRIQETIIQLQLKLKHLFSQINFLKKKKKKKKKLGSFSENKSIQNNSNQNNPHFILLEEMEYLHSGLKNQILGLKKYLFDQINLIYFQINKLQKERQNLIEKKVFDEFISGNEQKIRVLGGRLQYIGQKIKEYYIFFKEFQL